MEDIAKNIAKKKIMQIALTSFAGCLPFFLGFIALFIAVFFVLGLFDSDASAGISGNISYQSDCNYENTTVTVMDGDNTTVLATVSLEDYIIGVLCPEIGACDGYAASMPAEYIKVKYVAARTYVLSRGNYNSTTKSITIRASTRDQQWCSLDSGCIVTKTDDLVPGYDSYYFYNTYPGDYTGQLDGQITQRRNYTEQDLEILRQYYSETYGDLYLADSYDTVITNLNHSNTTSYKADTQSFWRNQALAGLSYKEILDSTGSANVPDASSYQNKSLYKLGSYCKSTSSTNNNNSENVSSSVNYVSWMLLFAIDNSHGYSMSNRTLPDVDCSSFVYYALLNNGYTSNQLGGTYPFTTASMASILTSIGFEQLPFDVNSLQEGDILWYPKGFNGHKYGHTEVYIGNGQTVGAHSNYDHIPGDSRGNEVSTVPVGTYQSIFRKKY